MARQREGFVDDQHRRVWSGSSIVNMLAASVQLQPGHPPAKLRNIAVLAHRESHVVLQNAGPASSLVVAIHVFPMIGKHTSATGPADRSVASPLAGSRR
jgi:hypothetical protein